MRKRKPRAALYDPSFERTVLRYAALLNNPNTVLVALDPALGRGASRTAYTIWRAHEEVAHGTLPLRAVGSTTDALVALYEGIQAVLNEHLGSLETVVVAVERLRGVMVHPHLHWAVGALLAGANPDLTIEVPIASWKAHAATDPNYVKSDEHDSRAIGRTVLGLVRGGGGSAPAGSRRKRARRAG